MSVKTIKLVTGEDIIAEIDDMFEGFYVLKNPVQVSMVPSRSGNQPTFGFIPFPLTSNDKEIQVSRANVVFVCEPAEEFLNQYNSLFGSGIITPSKQLLV